MSRSYVKARGKVYFWGRSPSEEFGIKGNRRLTAPTLCQMLEATPINELLMGVGLSVGFERMLDLSSESPQDSTMVVGLARPSIHKVSSALVWSRQPKPSISEDATPPMIQQFRLKFHGKKVQASLSEGFLAIILGSSDLDIDSGLLVCVFGAANTVSFNIGPKICHVSSFRDQLMVIGETEYYKLKVSPNTKNLTPSVEKPTYELVLEKVTSTNVFSYMTEYNQHLNTCLANFYTKAFPVMIQDIPQSGTLKLIGTHEWIFFESKLTQHPRQMVVSTPFPSITLPSLGHPSEVRQKSWLSKADDNGLASSQLQSQPDQLGIHGFHKSNDEASRHAKAAHPERTLGSADLEGTETFESRLKRELLKIEQKYNGQIPTKLAVFDSQWSSNATQSRASESYLMGGTVNNASGSRSLTPSIVGSHNITRPTGPEESGNENRREIDLDRSRHVLSALEGFGESGLSISVHAGGIALHDARSTLQKACTQDSIDADHSNVGPHQATRWSQQHLTGEPLRTTTDTTQASASFSRRHDLNMLLQQWDKQTAQPSTGVSRRMQRIDKIKMALEGSSKSVLDSDSDPPPLGPNLVAAQPVQQAGSTASNGYSLLTNNHLSFAKLHSSDRSEVHPQGCIEGSFPPRERAVVIPTPLRDLNQVRNIPCDVVSSKETLDYELSENSDTGFGFPKRENRDSRGKQPQMNVPEDEYFPRYEKPLRRSTPGPDSTLIGQSASLRGLPTQKGHISPLDDRRGELFASDPNFFFEEATNEQPRDSFARDGFLTVLNSMQGSALKSARLEVDKQDPSQVYVQFAKVVEQKFELLWRIKRRFWWREGFSLIRELSTIAQRDRQTYQACQILKLMAIELNHKSGQHLLLFFLNFRLWLTIDKFASICEGKLHKLLFSEAFENIRCSGRPFLSPQFGPQRLSGQRLTDLRLKRILILTKTIVLQNYHESKHVAFAHIRTEGQVRPAQALKRMQRFTELLEDLFSSLQKKKIRTTLDTLLLYKFVSKLTSVVEKDLLNHAFCILRADPSNRSLLGCNQSEIVHVRDESMEIPGNRQSSTQLPIAKFLSGKSDKEVLLFGDSAGRAMRPQFFLESYQPSAKYSKEDPSKGQTTLEEIRQDLSDLQRKHKFDDISTLTRKTDPTRPKSAIGCPADPAWADEDLISRIGPGLSQKAEELRDPQLHLAEILHLKFKQIPIQEQTIKYHETDEPIPDISHKMEEFMDDEMIERPDNSIARLARALIHRGSADENLVKKGLIHSKTSASNGLRRGESLQNHSNHLAKLSQLGANFPRGDRVALQGVPTVGFGEYLPKDKEGSLMLFDQSLNEPSPWFKTGPVGQLKDSAWPERHFSQGFNFLEIPQMIDDPDKASPQTGSSSKKNGSIGPSYVLQSKTSQGEDEVHIKVPLIFPHEPGQIGETMPLPSMARSEFALEADKNVHNQKPTSSPTRKGQESQIKARSDVHQRKPSDLEFKLGQKPSRIHQKPSLSPKQASKSTSLTKTSRSHQGLKPNAASGRAVSRPSQDDGTHRQGSQSKGGPTASSNSRIIRPPSKLPYFQKQPPIANRGEPFAKVAIEDDLILESESIPLKADIEPTQRTDWSETPKERSQGESSRRVPVPAPVSRESTAKSLIRRLQEHIKSPSSAARPLIQDSKKAATGAQPQPRNLASTFDSEKPAKQSDNPGLVLSKQSSQGERPRTRAETPSGAARPHQQAVQATQSSPAGKGSSISSLIGSATLFLKSVESKTATDSKRIQSAGKSKPSSVPRPTTATVRKPSIKLKSGVSEQPPSK